MKYESKNCPFCQNSTIHKHGKINNIERYKCPSCNKTFTFPKKLNPSDIWKDDSQGKQTYKELSIKYQCSVKTIQRYIDKTPKTALNSPISTYLKAQDYLNERSEKCNERGYFLYKHKGLRGAYASLKYYEKYLFTFEKYSELNIEKTTNRLEGLFSELKRKLINHSGLTKKRKIMFIKDFLNINCSYVS